jgi:hypothetical protein
MAYNPPTFKGNPTSGQTSSNFSGLRTDGNRVAMTGVLGNFMQTIDETGTPITSPVTVNTTSTILVPDQAAQITIVSVTNAVQVSEDSTQTAFFTLPAGVPWQFDCANMEAIYLKTGSSTVVSFYFTMI